LARAEDWVRSELDGEEVFRETNTMPQWAGSCWYYLRFMDPNNEQLPVSPQAEHYWGPVDLYIGGVEHAVLHLLYARFWHKVLYDIGLVHTKEPFQKLFNQGMILAYSHRDERGKYYAPDQVEERDGVWYVKNSDTSLATQIEKMSKSKYNVVNPDDIVNEFGADAMRLYEMFMGPLEATKPWQTNGVKGVYNFLDKAWSLVVEPKTGDKNPALTSTGEASPELQRELHKTIDKVGQDIEQLRFNTAIAKMMEFVNLARKSPVLPVSVIEPFVLVLAPFAPHLAEELWLRLGHQESLSRHPWPQADPAWLVEDTVTIAVQVNGKRRGEVSVAKDADQDTVVAAAQELAGVQRHVGDKPFRKVIYVNGRLLNLVV